jgi:hypothetical protein
MTSRSVRSRSGAALKSYLRRIRLKDVVLLAALIRSLIALVRDLMH